jgi:hypothetical protein
LTPDVLRAVFDALRADKRAPMFALPDTAIELRTKAASTTLAAAAIGGAVSAHPAANDGADANAAIALPSLLAKLLADLPGETRSGERTDGVALGLKSYNTGTGAADRMPVQSRGSQRQSDRDVKRDGADLARLILNVQSGGTIAHRVGTLPLIVDGRLVELDVALFEQPVERNAGDGGAGNATPALRHRQLVFAVTTERLGRVEVRATTAGTHMRVEINTENSDSSQALARHAARLSTDLETVGWQIDELAYRTTTPAASGMVPRTVREHLSAPGSISALA